MKHLKFRYILVLAIIVLAYYLSPFLFLGGLMARCDGEHINEIYRLTSIRSKHVLVRADNVCKDGEVYEALLYVLESSADNLSPQNLICLTYPPSQTLKGQWEDEDTLKLISSDKQACRWTDRLPSNIKFVFSSS